MVRFIVCALIAAGVLASPIGAEARQWKPTKTQEAIDYLRLEHQRGPRENVILIWIAPAFFENTAEMAPARQIFGEHMMLLVAHLHISEAGQWSFTKADDVVVTNEDGSERRPIPIADLPPVTATTVMQFGQIIAQGMGALGENASTLVFDSSGIDACGTGVVHVNYAGEAYEYVTPVPGC
jgi:hypothetical protein